jgi:pimeloyl-ACP methyl ester carboxylesterase
MSINRRQWIRDSALGAAGMASAMATLAKTSDAGVAPTTSATIDLPGLRHLKTQINGIEIHHVVAGQGPALLLLHGWPFTWFTWHAVLPELARSYTVIAPDLRGVGESGKPASGYDVVTLAEDALGLLQHLGISQATVVGHDLGVGIAFQLAARHPDRVSRLVLMESIVLGAPEAERFMNTPPWWVAFHNVPALPETLLVGREAAYLNWFHTQLSHEHRGISARSLNAQVQGYLGREALRGGFEHYRAFDRTTEQGKSAAAMRLRMPVLALGGDLVKDVLLRQMHAVGDDVRGGVIPRCGHIIQEERPDELLRRLRAFA